MILIEPGLIKTEFGEAAAAIVGEPRRRRPVRASSTHAVATATAGVYEGGLARLGGGPEVVAKKIEKAITARRPKTRYPVTASARLALGQRAIVSDRMWDRLMKRPVPAPGQRLAASRRPGGVS